MEKEKLKQFNAVIQICDCGKIDAYRGDGHSCDDERIKQINRDMSEYNEWD